MKRRTLCIALALALGSGPVFADERESLEVLKQTTVNLIDVLVENGVLTREKADALIRQAERKAATAAAAKAKERSGTVRVPYVPEVVKNEIREQIKQEVLAQAKSERWAEPNAIPGWLDTIKWEGDLRLRYQADLFDKNNTPPLDYVTATSPAAGIATRAAGFATTSNGLPTANTQDDRRRWRLRARLGMLARLTESWSADVRLATGSATDRVSTNQTLGQEFNKYDLFVDRAYLKYAPAEWLAVSGGRVPNPWFGTDLVWDDDLNFEGVVAAFSFMPRENLKPFLTFGAFPVKEESPPTSPRARWLYGLQAGAQWNLDSDTRLKFGLALYNYHNMEGRLEPNSAYDGIGAAPLTADYGSSQYGSGLRQKGNTLFRTNANNDNSATTFWGLASKFRPVSLTASLDLARFDPAHVILSADWVKNTAFDRNEILRRTGVTLADGNDRGYQYKLTVGMPQVKNPRDWQVSAAYRYLGSDAVVDAFTDSDFGLGGTNLKGYVLGAQLGLDRNVVLGLRWMSADSIDSFTLNPSHRFSVDVFQADVNLKF